MKTAFKAIFECMENEHAGKMDKIQEPRPTGGRSIGGAGGIFRRPAVYETDGNTLLRRHGP